MGGGRVLLQIREALNQILALSCYTRFVWALESSGITLLQGVNCEPIATPSVLRQECAQALLRNLGFHEGGRLEGG